MPMLRFNTDEGQAAAAALRQTIEAMQGELNRAGAAVEGLAPAHWQAPVADQFIEMSRAWQQRMGQSLEQLTDLTRRLETEIVQWEEAAAVFGGGGGGVGAALGGSTLGGVVPLGNWGNRGGDPGGGKITGFEPGAPGSAPTGHHTVPGAGEPEEVFLPKELIWGKELFDWHYESDSGWSDNNSPTEFEDYVDTNISLFKDVDGKQSIPLLQGKLLGLMPVAAAGYTLSRVVQLNVTDDGLAGKAEAGAEFYALEAEVDTEIAGFEITAEAQAGAQIGGGGQLEIDLSDGEAELSGEVGAFLGASAEGQISRDLGVADVGVTGEIGYGIGFNASGEIEFEDGHFDIEADLGAYLGLGGGIGIDVEFDVPEIVDTVIDVGEEAVDIGSTIEGWFW